MTQQDQTFECSFNLSKAIRELGFRVTGPDQYELVSRDLGRQIKAHLDAFCYLAFQNVGLQEADDE